MSPLRKEASTFCLLSYALGRLHQRQTKMKNNSFLLKSSFPVIPDEDVQDKVKEVIFYK